MHLAIFTIQIQVEDEQDIDTISSELEDTLDENCSIYEVKEVARTKME